MDPKIQIIALLFSIIATGIIFELVRKKKLREEYSLLWLAAGVCLILLSLKRELVESISRFMGVSYAPSALFIVALFFGMLLCLHFSLVLSKITERSKTLTQQNALLLLRVKELEQRLDRQQDESKAAIKAD